MDFDEPTIKVVKQEFIAVVLAGFGNECVFRAHETFCMIDL